MSYNLVEAAKATGKAKSTIHKALKSGKISGGRDEHGGWVIDPAELHRVYPPVSETSSPEKAETIKNNDLELLVNQLSEENRYLKEQLDKATDLVAEQSKTIDRQTQALLAAPERTEAAPRKKLWGLF